MTKSELLSWLREEQGRWEGLLDRVGEARMEEEGAAGSWSTKELVAHLTAWQRNLVARMSAAQRGEAAPAPPWPAELEPVLSDKDAAAPTLQRAVEARLLPDYVECRQWYSHRRSTASGE